jgi:hypothetical protein
MALDRRRFLQHYTAAIQDGDAALFIGAGLSQPAGFVDWRGLLRDCAQELGLDIDRERDLVAVAQYYLNRRNHERGRLNKLLKDAFDRPGTRTPNHDIIARLPIATVWTTNFDSLLEEAFRAAGRIVDVKSRDQDLAVALRGREVLLYKMHGDIARPDEAIICKDDYERYAQKHHIFQNALEGDLISKTFLFLGFSFTDPNLDYMLGHLRALLERNNREHYAVMRRVREDWHRDKRVARADFEYERNKQELQIEDLQRYSIQTVLVDSYAEVTDILKAVEVRCEQQNIFVSGSAHQFEPFGEDRMRRFCLHLGERVIERGYNLVCGMGLNVGDTVVKGALLQLVSQRVHAIEKRLHLRPFPRDLPPGRSEAAFNEQYRSDMLARAGVAIFLAGTSRSSELSAGVLHEYEIARRLGRTVIPVGATGYAARQIWAELMESLPVEFRGATAAGLFRRLGDATCSDDELIEAVFSLIEIAIASDGCATSEATEPRRRGSARKSSAAAR